MSFESLSKINVQSEIQHYDSGNLDSILSEIHYSLEQLIQDKTTHIINLRAMPLSPAEEQQLEQYLGCGEVKVELNALGKSTFYETNYSGVWLVTHYNPEAEVTGKQIEITYMPAMLLSPQEDVKSSLERFKTALSLLNSVHEK